MNIPHLSSGDMLNKIAWDLFHAAWDANDFVGMFVALAFIHGPVNNPRGWMS